jgi:hypothetical protein
MRYDIEEFKNMTEPIPVERESAQVKISVAAQAQSKHPPLQKAQGWGSKLKSRATRPRNSSSKAWSPAG